MGQHADANHCVASRARRSLLGFGTVVVGVLIMNLLLLSSSFLFPVLTLRNRSDLYEYLLLRILLKGNNESGWQQADPRYSFIRVCVFYPLSEIEYYTLLICIQGSCVSLITLCQPCSVDCCVVQRRTFCPVVEHDTVFPASKRTAA